MNILASYNWIKEYVTTRVRADEFARRLALSGPSVERAYPQAGPYEKMVVGRVTGLKDHPNADRLRIALTDIGQKRPAEIVCGGSNLEAGMKVVVALPGARVIWHGEGDPTVLEAAEIRGVKSAGMICAAAEIGLADAFPHADREIMDISWCKARPGTALAKALDLDDTVFDIEVTTNRPDAFCIVGLAREAAAILGGKFSWKEPVLPSLPKTAKPLDLTVRNQATRLCTRYQAVVVDGVTVGPSPWWLKNRLRMSGIRPINNIVDITNYVMLEYGQPMHAFDYAQLANRTIVVRRAQDGEGLVTLDGTERTLTSSDLVIADAERPIAVAGVMGGEATGVTQETKTIVFEAATFGPVSVRRTSRSLSLQTDSSLRFEKGLPEELTQPALARAVELCERISCGKVMSPAHDSWPAPRKRTRYSFHPQKAERLIGIRMTQRRMISILKSLGFQVSSRLGSRKQPRYEVTVPYWRDRDVEGERDLAEEIARIHGYHNLPSVLPSGELPAVAADPAFAAETRMKDVIMAAGHTELLNYSFVSRTTLEWCGFDPAGTARVANPLSMDFEYMRPSLVPGALLTVVENQGEFPEGRLFEVSGVYLKRSGSELPDERMRVMALEYSPHDDRQAFRRLKGLVQALYPDAGEGVLEFRRPEGPPAMWHPGRTVEVSLFGERLGLLGEMHPAVASRFGIDGRVTAFELDLADGLKADRSAKSFRPLPQYPPVRRDIAFVVDEGSEYADLERLIRDASTLLERVELFDIYRGAGVEAGRKSLAVHLTFLHPDRTLTAEEVEGEMTRISSAIEQGAGATIRA